MMRIVVDLPAPFGPRKPVTAPGRHVKLTSSTAVKPAYAFVRFWTWIMVPLWRTSTRRRIRRAAMIGAPKV
jgi:hypothetical protein